MDRFHKRKETYEETKNLKTRQCMARDLEIYVGSVEKRKGKQKCVIENQMLDNARKLRGIYFIDPADEEFKVIMKKKKNARGKVGSSDATSNALQNSTREVTGRPVALKRSSRQNTLALSKPTSLQECAWKDHTHLSLCLKQ